jgi:DNA helicase-2/ATP-dependent DNA helicase PcrA
MLENDDSAESETRLENLRELVGSILLYEEEAAAGGEVSTLSGYLERVTLTSDVDALEETPKVAMMTAHAAKGLEFDTVFLTGMEEELFPFQSTDPRRKDDMEEERRLAYVAITRARRKLYLTHASRRTIFGMTRFGLPSRFVGDLPREAVRHEMTAACATMRAGRENPSAIITRPRGGFAHPQEAPANAMRGSAPSQPREPGERYVEPEPDASGVAAHRGARVRHKVFGIGWVEGVDGGDDPVATVKFSGHGTKRIKARFLAPA